MIHLLGSIHRKLRGLILHLVGTGIVILMLGVLIVWTDFMLRLVVGLFILTVGYIFIYSGFKLWIIKKEINRYFKL